MIFVRNIQMECGDVCVFVVHPLLFEKIYSNANKSPLNFYSK